MNGMQAFQKRTIALMILSGALMATGCKKAVPVQNSDGTVTNPNGSVTVPAQAAPQATAVRNPDGSITNPDGSVTYPAGSKVANREAAPNGPAPAPGAAPVVGSTPAPPAPIVRVTAPVGTPIVIRTSEGLAASRNDPGDHFSGVLDRPVVVHGETLFAAGTAVSGEVVASKGKGRFKGAGDLGIQITSIGRERVATSEYEKVSPGRGKRTAGFAGGGAGLGAIIGGIAGGGKGALIGGLAGGAGGTAAGAYTGSRDVVIPAESLITFRLTEAISH